MNQVTLEGVSYNANDFLSDNLSEQEFIQRGLWEGKYRGFSDEDRRKLLKQAYELIKQFNKGAV